MSSSMGPRSSTPRPCEDVEREFVVVNALGNGGIFKQGAQFGREREAQGDFGFGAHAHAEVGLLLNRFHNVEQRQAPLRFRFGFRFGLGGGRRRYVERERETVLARRGVEGGGLLGGGFFDELVLDGLAAQARSSFKQSREFEFE